MSHLSGPTDIHRDEDEIYRLLESEENQDIYRMREKRIHLLKSELNQLSSMKEFNHGTYELLDSEKKVMEITTKKLSKKHFKTKFAKIDVENAPFLVDRMKIQVLPCVVSFIDGIAVDKIIGFDKLGNNENFTTSSLEDLLESAGSKARRTIFGFKDETDELEDEG